MGVVEEESAGISVREEDKAFIAKVYSYIFVGLMLDWIKDDMKEEPEQLVGRLALVIQGTFANALERFRIEKTLSKTEDFINKMNKEFPGKVRIFRSMALFTGICVIILLI